jgi:parallel beta-helix repeat protein
MQSKRGAGSQNNYLREIRMLRILFASIAFLASVSAQATIWYVATTGNDTNGGSSAAPFATITHAATVAQPGDTVYIRGGVYNQRVAIWSSGTATARIVYRAYGTERVILDGTGLLDNGNPADLVTLGGSYVDWIGFEVRNATAIGVVTWQAHDQRILTNIIHNSGRNGFWAGGGTTVSNLLISGNRVYDNVLENRARNWDGGWGQAIGVGYGDNVTITNNVVYRNYGEGIFLGRTDDSRIASNEVFDNYSANIYLSHALRCVVDSNLVYSTLDKNYYRTPTSTHPAKGILLANEENNVDTQGTAEVDVINNVVLRAEWGIGFWKDSQETVVNSMTDCRIANNTVYAPTLHALHIDPDTNHTGIFVENNIFALPSGSTATLQSVPSPTTGFTYRNNNWSSHPGSPVYNSTYDELGDPQFALAGGSNAEDYKLTPTSPGKDQGRPLTYVTKDYWLKTRSGTWDIGAHEY